MMHRRRQRARALLALAFALLLPFAAAATPAQAQEAVITVNSTADLPDHSFADQICDANPDPNVVQCTLRAALMEANFRLDPNTIRLPSGTYLLTARQPNGSPGSSGALPISTPLTIQGVGGSAPVIDAAGLTDAFGFGDRVFSIGGPKTNAVRLERLTIRGGSTSAGGGISIAGPNVTIHQSTISGNTGGLGGGIRVDNGTTLTLVQSIVSGNTAVSNGGGLHITEASKVVIRDSQIRGNIANSTSQQDGHGGGILVVGSATLEVSGSSIKDNVASRSGGGIYATAAVRVLTTTISGNSATEGGGVAILESAGSISSFRIERSAVTNNRSDNSGGGLLIEPSITPQLTNTTVSGNVARTSGGGIASRSHLILNGVTIVRNQASIGGGVAAGGVTAVASIIADNSATTSRDCLSSLALLGQHNLSTGCTFQRPAENTSVGDPALLKLGPLAFNGGPTATHLPLAGSPAIDAFTSFLSCPKLDQRGATRFQGKQCDIGAVEVSASTSVGSGALVPAELTASPAEPVALTLRWTLPAPRSWNELAYVEFQLADEEGRRALLLHFTQGLTETAGLSLSDGLALYHPDGTLAGAGELGKPGVLESEGVWLDLGQSALEAPPGQTVTLRLALRFRPEMAGRSYSATLTALDDDGTLQGPEPVGTVRVSANPPQQPAFRSFLPLVRR